MSRDEVKEIALEDDNESGFFEAMPLFKEKLRGYRSYHQHETNILLHLIGIPDIILSLFLVTVTAVASSVQPVAWTGYLLTFLLFGLMGFHFFYGGWRGISTAILGVAFGALAYSGLVEQFFGIWLAIEGVVFSIIMIVGGWMRKGVSPSQDLKAVLLGGFTLVGLIMFFGFGPSLHNLTTSPWIAAAALFSMGFYYHIPGHALFEGNRPALMDDISQTFLAAPHEFVDIIVRAFRR